jgi:hypothetical protein
MVLSELVQINKDNFDKVIKNKGRLEESEKVFFRLKGNESLRDGWVAEKWYSEIDKKLDFKEDLECGENDVEVPLRYCVNQSLC